MVLAADLDAIGAAVAAAAAVAHEATLQALAIEVVLAAA